MKRIELEYYDVSSFEVFKYNPDKPPIEQCSTFAVRGKVVKEDDSCIVICTEEETSSKGEQTASHPYRDVTIIPKNWIKSKMILTCRKKKSP
jgi:hypothetical protein